MLTLVRHLLAILLLPVVVTIVMPSWLMTRYASIDSRWSDPVRWPARGLGVLVLVAGVSLFLWCVVLFARVGRGTLAPWDPTQRLVAVGPYRYVRNPMISGVATILAGQALITGSWVIALWLLVFVAINQTYFLLSEEPGLERRFGDSYREYKARVPRWIPRRPADPESR
ncbi:MAG TPA: isoprenylcysteine carboxylmethyltransferase family protein [Gemmatimonadaceae bacterium]|nr:isoprenylcysteine carboxylmethyltransferase family protein [Gemmatimonadaceae bacterium]